MKVLVTGGLGYIGSHTCVELLKNHHEVIVLDDLSNSKMEVLDRIEKIVGIKPIFYQGNMIDEKLLDSIFKDEDVDAVIDFAAFKAVGESVEKPVEYYQNNVSTVLNLLKVMDNNDVRKLVFSSSATVYGDPKRVPIKEDDPTGNTTNPYGTSKLMVEKILMDLYNSNNNWDIAILRYFNPIGAHESGLIGEDPNGIPANLVPYVAKVANKELDHLTIYGDDYPTPDGTGYRDYIHVVDLAIGHIKALEKLNREGKGLFIYNLGTGKASSVLDIVNTFKRVNNVDVPYEIGPRRSGDIAECYADCEKAQRELGFKATRTLEDMCRDAYNFIINNK